MVTERTTLLLLSMILGICVIILSLIAIIRPTVPAYADPRIEWLKTFGGPEEDHIFSGLQTDDGSYILAGYTETSDGDTDFYLVKVDANGDEEWSKTYGDPEFYEYGFCVQQASDGGFVTVGVDDWGRAYLVKTDVNGDEQWDETYGEPYWLWDAESVQQTTDGGYIIAGTVYDMMLSEYPFLIKTDSDGSLQWMEIYWPYGYVKSAQQTSDGGYIMVETTTVQTGGSMVRLLKTNSEGDLLWVKELFEGEAPFKNPSTWGWSVQQTTDGGYIIGGFIRVIKDDGYHYDAYLVKTDANGEEEWSNTFGDPEHDEKGYSVYQTTDGGYIIAGVTDVFDTWIRSDVYVVKTNSNGYMQWTKTISNNYRDYGYSVQQASDGGYLIAGYTQSLSTINSDALLIKIDSMNVEIEWINLFGSPNVYADCPLKPRYPP